MNRAALLIIAVALFGCRSKDDATLGNLFFERGVTGGIVISSLDGKIEYLYNSDCLETPFSPNSTFYLLNVLIALKEKAVADEKEILSWDGEDRGLAEWNRDQSLVTAFRYSCVWFHQAIAQKIGLSTYLSNLKAARYGNEQVGKEVSSFWLNDDLLISAKQQVDFLKRLYLESLPFDKAHMRTLKRMLAVRRTPNETVYAKTARASKSPSQHGWNIGFVETKNKGTWFFALIMTVEDASSVPFLWEIVDAALAEKKILL